MEFTKTTQKYEIIQEQREDDLVCIVTGGYQGIGEIVAGYIADAGADIAIFDMNDAREVADRISNEYGVKTKRC